MYVYINVKYIRASLRLWGVNGGEKNFLVGTTVSPYFFKKDFLLNALSHWQEFF